MNGRRLHHQKIGFAGVLLLITLTSLPAFSQQQSFERTQQDQQLQFSYQWQEATGTSRSLSFSSDRQPFLNSFQRFRNYNLKRANRELYQQLTRFIKQQNYRGVEVTLSPRQQQLSIAVKETRQRHLQQQHQQQAQRVRSYYQQQWQDYLSANYYRYLRLPSGEQGIIPDAVQIAAQQQSLFNPLIEQIGHALRDNSRRSYTDYIAQFIQAIPYDAQEDGINNRGDGYLPPNQVLYYNQGDCDSKAGLMAALLKPIIPQAKMAIVYLPGHALFAISMASTAADATIEDGGTKLVLVEVAGPAIMPAGNISAQSQFYIDSGQYVVVPLSGG